MSYNVKLDGGAIITCSCPAYQQSAITYKHMFLAHRITTNNIRVQNAILPPTLPVAQSETVEEQIAQKRVLLDKAEVIIAHLSDRSHWTSFASDDALVRLSRAGLTQCLSASEGLAHLQR
ncbi:hypothetical protein M422DRAFT_264569 [Sphaerobolus stellatus SS14]|uniref:SWIM-type domain-containing protein n=1 Tax=Sphaerobolus stellatus (strain SS14) TaxID=990650 RepID=A0A0C9UFD7_SPHS4|nr:hypothetical protein M422DRAFT_264569 [Sphaerobolus stellatus SS14]